MGVSSYISDEKMNYRDVFGGFMETPLYICDAPTKC